MENGYLYLALAGFHRAHDVEDQAENPQDRPGDESDQHEHQERSR